MKLTGDERPKLIITWPMELRLKPYSSRWRRRPKNWSLWKLRVCAMNIWLFKNYWKVKNETMKKRVLLLLFLASASNLFSQEYQWQNITVDIKSSFRALSVVDDKVVWISGSKGWIGRSRNSGKGWSFQQIKAFEELDFRSIYAF